MITRHQKANAERITALAGALGHLPYNEHGQTPTDTLNLSVPLAQLVVTGLVTGVAKDDNDGITDSAVAEVEALVRRAVEFTTARDGAGWWNDEATRLGL
jgi:hypothetical protein